jgi:hypothetical protein
MTKTVFRAAVVILGGHDISHRITRWNVGGKVGEVYRVQLDIIDDGSVQIEEPEWFTGKVRVAKGGDEKEPRKITVNGTDISNWVHGYDRLAEVDELDTIRLHMYADSDVLSINGTHPWEDKGLS